LLTLCPGWNFESGEVNVYVVEGGSILLSVSMLRAVIIDPVEGLQCSREEIDMKERSPNASSSFRRSSCLLLNHANKVEGASKNYWGHGSGWGVFIRTQRAAGIFTARISPH